MNTEQLAEIEARANAATTGWTIEHMTPGWVLDTEQWNINKQFIVAARTDVPLLIAALRAERAKLEWVYKYGMTRTLGCSVDDYDYHPIDRDLLEKAYKQ